LLGEAVGAIGAAIEPSLKAALPGEVIQFG
jgi:hypothetical protein